MKNIGIIGLGLLGGSCGLALQQAAPQPTIIGFDQNPTHQEQALALGLVHQLAPLATLTQQCQLIILAVPVTAIVPLLPSLLDTVPTTTTVVDFGSAKQQITQAVAQHPKRAQYVALHPMAGTAQSGPQAATPQLFAHKTMVLCQAAQSSSQALEQAQWLCQSLQMPMVQRSPQEHDQQLAWVSHLPQMAAYALGNALQQQPTPLPQLYQIAGSGLATATRLSHSPASMWGPIAQQNQPALLQALKAYQAQLSQLINHLEAHNYPAAQAFMAQAAQLPPLK